MKSTGVNNSTFVAIRYQLSTACQASPPDLSHTIGLHAHQPPCGKSYTAQWAEWTLRCWSIREFTRLQSGLQTILNMNQSSEKSNYSISLWLFSCLGHPWVFSCAILVSSALSAEPPESACWSSALWTTTGGLHPAVTAHLKDGCVWNRISSDISSCFHSSDT